VRPRIDLGCGLGFPITEVLVAEGLNVFAVDAAPSFVEAFRRNLPNTPVVCEAVQDSTFFDRRFEAVLAWGLIFLLSPEDQRHLIRRIVDILVPGGRLLFTSCDGAEPLVCRSPCRAPRLWSTGVKECLSGHDIELIPNLLSKLGVVIVGPRVRSGSLPGRLRVCGSSARRSNHGRTEKSAHESPSIHIPPPQQKPYFSEYTMTLHVGLGLSN
jgi:SAM-dependent methyltransferase